MTETMTQAEFSRHIGVEKSYVTELKKNGRLVFDENGKVMVDESTLRIAATEDPSKSGVADRHAAARQGKDDNDEMTGRVGSAYQQARAMKEKYAAMQAKIAYEKEVGELLKISDIRAAIMDGDTIIRNRLESMPDTLSPQLAVENDEQKIRAMLIDHVEWLLTDLSQSLKNLEYI